MTVNNICSISVSKTDGVKAYNAYLDVLPHKVYEAKKQLIELSKPVTAANIKNLLLGIEEKNQNIYFKFKIISGKLYLQSRKRL
ncbi:hypothetical protein QWZ08_11135 [Ferruginibacter paludis]|uniref:hypothetical protein n=1 Tax=Ferruginibacter paludis TaxID=1310417 RepID=UPI0025B2C8FC|nr:hypothetical protein [Ferruginibacter paludis]MDN3656184.1 hypothetical protein [Ferruginibacter paludis]